MALIFLPDSVSESAVVQSGSSPFGFSLNSYQEAELVWNQYADDRGGL